MDLGRGSRIRISTKFPGTCWLRTENRGSTHMVPLPTNLINEVLKPLLPLSKETETLKGLARHSSCLCQWLSETVLLPPSLSRTKE